MPFAVPSFFTRNIGIRLVATIIAIIVIGMIYAGSNLSSTNTNSPPGNWPFMFLVAVGLGLAFTLHNTRGGGSSWPAIDIIAVLIGAIVLHFAWCRLSPEMWMQMWVTSKIFAPTLLICFFIIVAIRTSSSVRKWSIIGAAVFATILFSMATHQYATTHWCWAISSTNYALRNKNHCTPPKTSGKENSAEQSLAEEFAEQSGEERFSGNARDQEMFFGPERDTVIAYFRKTPLLADISAAESHFNQWKPSVSRDSIRPGCDDVERNENTNGTYDLGVMQINSIHKARADSLGIDICTLGGNLLFAQKLYDTEGERPWISSQAVWREHYLNPNAMVSEGGMKVKFIETATVGPWSEWIDGKGCKIGFRGVNHRNISIAVANSPDEPSVIYSFDPKAKGQPQEIPSGRYIRFRSNTETKVTIRMEVEC